VADISGKSGSEAGKTYNGGLVAPVADVAPFPGNGGDRAFEVVGRSTPGSRCLFCGKGGEVHLVRGQGEREVTQAHLACAEKAWGDPQPPTTAAPPPASADDGVGISAWRIRRLTDEYHDRAYANAQETGGDTRTADLDAWLRQKLADEGVLPEFVEVEFERVMAVVFRV
jgi:hypothetical protein